MKGRWSKYLLSGLVIAILAGCSSRPTDRGQQYKDGRLENALEYVNEPNATGKPVNAKDYANQVMEVQYASSALYGRNNTTFQAVEQWLRASIHADAFTNRAARGSSVFALSTKGATSAAARFLAQTQNESDQIGGVGKSGDRYLDHTMFDLVQTATISDSLKFGKEVLTRMGKINHLHKNKVDQAGFAVLKAPDIPSILVETAFISNVEEERKLKTSHFQQKVAESILAGIKAYFADGGMSVRR